MPLLDHFTTPPGNGPAEEPKGFRPGGVAAPPVKPPPGRSTQGAPRTPRPSRTVEGTGAQTAGADAIPLPTKPDPAIVELKVRVHEELVRDLDPAQLVDDVSFNSPARRAVEQAAEERLAASELTLGRQERTRLASEIADEVLGLGPLEPLLRDTTITEIMVNSHERVFIERGGVLYPAECYFRDDAHVLTIIDKILRPLGRRLDDSSPMVDARLRDGSRVNAIIPPLAVHGPSLTIRKFARDVLLMKDLIRLGTLTKPVADMLGACVRSRLNILVSGGTGTGKTTLLNNLSAFVPARERLVSIEDPAELQLKHVDWVSLETRPPNIEGRGQVVQRDLVKNALRMRPDRIIVGECRAGEAFDMLQAMNTGHDGSLTTVHANTARDALARLENMILMAVELPVQAIREQIAAGINLVIQITRMQDGARRVTHIAEIVGMQGGVVSMHDLFTFVGRGIDANGKVLGSLQSTGLRPHFMERLSQFGEELPLETFMPPAGVESIGEAVVEGRH